METIRLQKDNIKEICDKLDNLGYDDFSPITEEISKKNGLDIGIFYFGFESDISAIYRVKDNWEFQFNDDGTVGIKHF